MRQFQTAAVLSVALVAAPAAADARCRTRAELSELGTAVRADLSCGAAAIVGRDATACVVAAPRCGHQAMEAFREVAFGAGGAPSAEGSLAARRCQLAIADATGHFAEHRLRERARGSRRTRAGRIPRGISRRCDGVVVASVDGHSRPAVGGPCAPLAATVGRRIDGPALGRCVRASLEQIIDGASPKPMRPNIVLIVSDDQRMDTLGYMPSTFERLAGQGLAFRNAFATTPSCSPSRASIYTGQIARRHGVIANGYESRFDSSETIATSLSAAGYVNGFFGKYMNGQEELELDAPPGWDEWNVFLEPSGGSYFGSWLNENGAVRVLGAEQYSTDVLADRAVAFVGRNASQPFFLVYAPYAPHSPSTPAPRHQGLFAGLAPHRPPSWREADVSLKPIWVQYFAHIASPEGAMRRDRLRLDELETLLAVDDGVRAISDALERAGLTDETLVVYTSDHGIHLGEHWTGTKFSAYEESIRVPFVMRYPARIPLPRSADELVANIDLAPTIVELAQAPPLAAVDGQSLVPLLDGGGAAPPWRKHVALESWGGLITRPSRALRTDRWKYIEVDAQAGIRVELYDLAADPYELENRASDPAVREVRDDLAERLTAALPPRPLPASRRAGRSFN